MISYSQIINVPLDVVWKNFLYKIKHPENFVPGVSNVLVKEQNADYVIREMDIVSPSGLTDRIIEKITFSPNWVNFSIVHHPIYSGFVYNLAEKISDNETKVTFSINWQNKVTGEFFSNDDVVKNAVLKTIEFILTSHKL